MICHIRDFKLDTGLMLALLAGFSLVGCSVTAAPEPSIIQRAHGEQPAPPPPTGFLGNDYSLLTPPARDPTSRRCCGTSTRALPGAATTRS